ncbi:MAG TPA: hypothetical protein VFR27_14575 [Mycobacterium sp.]|nr:hypothetical protein [Mycobacterium sp.]
MTAIATRPLSDSTDSLLRFAMRADATLTGFLGLAGAATAGPLAALTGLTATQEYLLGALFVLCGLTVFSLAALPNLRHAGITVIAANVVCTVGAVAAVESAVLPLTGIGVAAFLASGAYTAFFAVVQYLGLRRLA